MNNAQRGETVEERLEMGVLFEDLRYFHWQVLHAFLAKGG